MGQFTPNIGLYIPSAGETNYSDSFAQGMINLDQHDHSGGPNKGLPITSSGLADFSVTYRKLSSNVVDPLTGIGVNSTPGLQNQLQILGILRNLFQLASVPGVGFVAMNGTTVAARSFQNSSSISWSNPSGILGDPSASLIAPVSVSNGGTGLTSAPVPYAPILAGTTGTGAFQQPPSLGSVGDVFTSNGPGAVGSFQPLGGLGQIQYVNFTLTAAQVRALDTTSVQVLPAQGAGKVIVPIYAYGLLNSDGTAFTLASGTTSIGFFYNDVDLAMNFSNPAFRVITTDTYWWANPATNSAGAVKTNAQNTPFYIGMNGPLVPYLNGGNSTIDFTLAYTVITL